MTRTLQHGGPIRSSTGSTGLTRTDHPFRMRNLPSDKDEWHSWVIIHEKISCYHQPEKFPGRPARFASQSHFPCSAALQLQRG